MILTIKTDFILSLQATETTWISEYSSSHFTVGQKLAFRILFIRTPLLKRVTILPIEFYTEHNGCKIGNDESRSAWKTAVKD
jgi:hypothetical protein